MAESSSDNRSYKEQRIREITLIYYSRPDIRKAIFDFSQNRECIPRYFQGFGKRPDTFQYESDILEQVRKGATSFHCSEEIWSDPLEISTELSRPELDSLRDGWDLLLDIDSPYLEYSKIYADLLVKMLEFHGIENLGVKFSGSKGFHVIVPWKSFPEEIYGKKTKEMFPEWPRIICEYLSETIKPRLASKIYTGDSEDIARRTGRDKEEMFIMKCNGCNRSAIKKELVTWICPVCKNEIIMIRKNKRKPKCPNDDCRKEMVEKQVKEIYYCEYCNVDSNKNPEFFGRTLKKGLSDFQVGEEYDTKIHIDADLVLVAPRHLFRMPYSLHEKTALASTVIDKNKIMDFQVKDAKPFKIDIKPFYPDSKPGEAKELLLQSLDWKEQKEKDEKIIQDKKVSIPVVKPKSDYKQVTIPNPSNDIFPPQIKLLLNGVKHDGRKRALFILISFFKSLGVPDNETEKRIYEWNEKNYQPLKKGYIQSQLSWSKRNPKILPPNFDNPIYKDLAVDKPDSLSKQTKNPVSYAVKRYFSLRK